MKKKVIVGAVCAIVAVAAVVAVIVFWPRRFALSITYLGETRFHEIDVEQLQELINQKQSFALFIYQPACVTSEDFEKNLVSFSEKEKMGFEKIKFSEARSSGLVEGLRYYPSVALYHDGELVTFLRTDRNDDMAAYDTEEGFAAWWWRYIKM